MSPFQQLQDRDASCCSYSQFSSLQRQPGSDPSCWQHLSSPCGQDLGGKFCTSPVDCFSCGSSLVQLLPLISHLQPRVRKAVVVSSFFPVCLEWQLNSLEFLKLFPRQKSSLGSPGPLLSFLCFYRDGATLSQGQEVFFRGKKTHNRPYGLTNFNFLGRVLHIRRLRESQIRWEKVESITLRVFQCRSPEAISFLPPPLLAGHILALSIGQLPIKPQKTQNNAPHGA